MSELPRTDDPALEAERLEEALATLGDRIQELEAVAAALRAELRALRGRRDAPPRPDDDEEWPVEAGASPSPHWVAAVPPPLTRPSAVPRLLAEGAFLVAVALLAGLADLSAAWIALVMVLAWALVASAEWAAAATRTRWRLDEVAPLAAAADAQLDTTGPWDMPVVQATAVETADGSESRTVVAKLPAESEEVAAEAEAAEEVEQTTSPSTGGRRLRFWRRPPVETARDPWEA